MTDAELLAAFVAGRDPACFEELVRRHGPLVLRTCERLLPQPADAEDAFQAVFVVLARRAAEVRAETLANWLYGVANRVALRARSRSSRQRAHEKQATPPDPAGRHDPAGEVVGRELVHVVDEELNRLPSNYRAAVILCCLEGKTTAEAAREMGCSRGVVVGNLTRGRNQLRHGLARRGMLLGSAALNSFLAAEALARVAAPLAAETAKKAAAAAGTALRLKLIGSPLAAWSCLLLLGLAALSAAGSLLLGARPTSADGLVGHYTFRKDSGGRVHDDSSQGNDGALAGGVVLTEGPRPAAKALQFDGKTGHVRLDRDVGTWLGGTATVAFWVRTTQVGNTADASPAIIGVETRNNLDITWGWLDRSGRVGLTVGVPDQPTRSALSRRPVNDDRWHHVALTRDAGSGQTQVYVDGRLDAAVVSGAGVRDCPLNVIGRMSSQSHRAAYFFQGSLGEIHLYNRVLSLGEIQQLAR